MKLCCYDAAVRCIPHLGQLHLWWPVADCRPCWLRWTKKCGMSNLSAHLVRPSPSEVERVGFRATFELAASFGGWLPPLRRSLQRVRCPCPKSQSWKRLLRPIGPGQCPVYWGSLASPASVLGYACRGRNGDENPHIRTLGHCRPEPRSSPDIEAALSLAQVDSWRDRQSRAAADVDTEGCPWCVVCYFP